MASGAMPSTMKNDGELGRGSGRGGVASVERRRFVPTQSKRGPMLRQDRNPVLCLSNSLGRRSGKPMSVLRYVRLDVFYESAIHRANWLCSPMRRELTSGGCSGSQMKWRSPKPHSCFLPRLPRPTRGFAFSLHPETYRRNITPAVDLGRRQTKTTLCNAQQGISTTVMSRQSVQTDRSGSSAPDNVCHRLIA
jgi:hypothetical protein